ncbi:hypothetical protein GX586_13265, partial [bacterium]|nr:hypothetical protein [bacterium]
VFSGPWGNNGYSIIINHRYWLEDKPHYLDEAGEFWFHKTGASSGRLYVRMPGDAPPSNYTVEAARHTALIYKYRGTADYIEISGLTFRFGNIYWPLEYRDFQDYPSVVSGTITIEGNAIGFVVRNCTFEYVAQAVRFRSYGATDLVTGLLIADNDIRYCDRGAITVLDGGKLDLVQVLRNRIRDTGLRPWRVNGNHTLQVNYALRPEIAGNMLERVGGAGLFIFGGKGSGSMNDVPFARILMHHNKVKDSLLCANDWGGIENWQGGPFYVYNNISRNAAGRQNFKPGRFGAHFYLDGAFKSYHFNNIAWGEQVWVLNKMMDAPTAYNQVLGYNNTFFNNASYNCGPVHHQMSSSTGRSKYLGIVSDTSRTYVFDNPATTSTANYDTLAYDWNVVSGVGGSFGRFENSGSYSTPAAFATALNNRKAMAWATGVQSNSSSFTDAANGDFRLKAGSPAIDAAGKVFVPWALSHVEGEWGFNLNRNTPNVILDEAWYLRASFIDRELYQYQPTMPLTCVNTTAGSFIASPLETWAPGALRLDGSSQYAYSPGSGPSGRTLDIGTNSFIIEVYFRTVPDHTGGVLVCKYSTDGYALGIDELGQAKFSLRRGDAWVYQRSGGVMVNDGAWHHLLVEFARTTSLISMFVDGVRVGGAGSGAVPMAGVSIVSSAQFLVGKGPAGSHFAGDVDFLRISRATLAMARTTIEELYDWQFGGPFLADFRGVEPHGRRDAGPLEYSYAGEDMPCIVVQPTNIVIEVNASGGIRVTALNADGFHWAKDGSAMSLLSGPCVTFNYVQPANAGVYTVCASNAAGVVTSAPITVTVVPEPLAGAMLVLAFSGVLARMRPSIHQ